jgi:thymidylate kinase
MSASPSRGALIVLVGPDGSGKTTVADALVGLLRAEGREAERLYMGVGLPGLPSRRLRRRLRRRRAKRRGQTAPAWLDPARPHRRTELLHVWLDLWWRYLFDIRPRLRQRRVVVCDRYAYDWATWHVRGISAGTVRRMLRFGVPRPALTVFLSAEPDVVISRKDELTAEEVRRQQARLAALVAVLPRAVELDCTPPAEAVARSAAELLKEPRPESRRARRGGR